MEIIKRNWVHFVAVVIFFLSALISFYPSTQGKKIQQGDIIHWQGMAKEIKTHTKKTGEYPLWTNSMFGGMPAYYIHFQQTKDPIDYLQKVLALGFNNEIGKFMVGMILFYMLLLLMKVNPWLAIFGAIAFAFNTNNLVLLNAGHNTKIMTLMTSPLIIAGVLLAYRDRALLGTLLFTVGMSMNLKSQHPQMTYYLGIVLLLYVLAVFINKIKTGEIGSFAKASGFLLIGLALAVGTTANRTLPIYEYSKDTMRGAPILTKNKSKESSSNVEGLAWNYAMGWSNGGIDLLQSFIPLAVGGSSGEKISKASNFAKEIRKRGGSIANLQAPLYWGKLPFTSGPIYFGAVIFFFFFLSIFTYKDPIKWWILAAVILTFVLSMGKNFESINRLFFDYFPYYNKFRTPNSILSVTAIIIPILAILGLQDILSRKSIDLKKILLPGLGFIVFTALLGLLGPSILDLSSPGDVRLEQAGLDSNIIISDRADMLRDSALRSAILMLICLGSVVAYFKGKIKAIFVFLIIGLLAIGDLFTTNLRYVSSDNYVTASDYKRYYTPRKVDLQILKDPDLSYRVFDNTKSTFKSSFTSYFHKSIGGYHAAKLQRYADIIDYHISKNNTNVMNMLNTKYLITGEPGNEKANLNTAALGNVWFVNEAKIVSSSDAEIEALTDFDPLRTAFIHKEYENQLTTKTFEKNGSSISLTSYAPDRLVYKCQAVSEQLAVFSEIWYGPEKGWNAYIDGQPVSHLRANYILRALKIPAGNHEIVFEFKPSSYKTGETIRWISCLILLLAGGFYAYNRYKESRS